MNDERLLNEFDTNKFRAYLNFILRHEQLSDSTSWERAIALSTNSVWLNNDRYIADAYNERLKVVLSVKSVTRNLKSRMDFFENSNLYPLMEVIANRCPIPSSLNDNDTASVQQIGDFVIKNYKEKEEESLVKYKSNIMLDVVVEHGSSANGLNYYCNVYFFHHDLKPIKKWGNMTFGPKSKNTGDIREIIGYTSDGLEHVGRVSKGQYETCTKIWYNPVDALCIHKIAIKTPKPVEFNYEKEIQQTKNPINFSGDTCDKIMSMLTLPSQVVKTEESLFVCE